MMPMLITLQRTLALSSSHAMHPCTPTPCIPTMHPPTLPHHTHTPLTQDWPQFFKMPVIMLMLITLLNDGALISIGYDHVHPTKYPEKWNLKAGAWAGTLLAAVAT